MNPRKHYIRHELEKLKPLDQYGVRVKLSSSSGKTKTLMLSEELIAQLEKLVRELPEGE